MPQTTTEKKFFRLKVRKKSGKTEAEILQSSTIIKFQGFKKNITGGKE